MYKNHKKTIRKFTSFFNFNRNKIKKKKKIEIIID